MSKPGLAEKKMMAWFGGDMPEEKVSQLEIGKPCPTCGCKVLPKMGVGDYSCVACGMGMKEPCEHWKKMLENPRSDDEDDIESPAADAGPRQPSEVINEWISMLEHPDFGAVPSKKSMIDILRTIKQIITTNPPVPQEAAPRLPSGLSKGAGYKTLGAFPVPCATNSSEEATAPDWAMRQDEPLKALRQWEADTEAPANASEGNAFIDGFNAGRQAGSERERELTRRLQITLADIDTLLEVADSNVHPKVLDMIKLSRAEASRLLGGESK